MVRFLTIIACLAALSVGALLFTSRFTITVTFRPLDAQLQQAPHQIPAETPATLDVGAQPKAKPGHQRIDSHHTKGA